MVSALSLRFLLESRPIHDLNVPILDLNQPLCAEAGQIPRDHFPNRSEARRDLLVGHREIEGLGTRSFRSVQQQARQALRDTSESHRFDQTDEMAVAAAPRRPELSKQPQGIDGRPVGSRSC